MNNLSDIEKEFIEILNDIPIITVVDLKERFYNMSNSEALRILKELIKKKKIVNRGFGFYSLYNPNWKESK